MTARAVTPTPRGAVEMRIKSELAEQGRQAQDRPSGLPVPVLVICQKKEDNGVHM
jgi:hypothetical protein